MTDGSGIVIGAGAFANLLGPTPWLGPKPMRRLTNFCVPDDLVNELITIYADSRNSAGGCHEYTMIWPVGWGGNQNQLSSLTLRLQNGAICERGMNGVTPESLINCLVDHFEGFQQGENACSENVGVIAGLSEALRWLGERKERVAEEHATRQKENQNGNGPESTDGQPDILDLIKEEEKAEKDLKTESGR